MANEYENTPFGTYGEFEGYDQTADWTEQDWRNYDQYLAEEMATFDAGLFEDVWEEDLFMPAPEDFHVPF